MVKTYDIAEIDMVAKEIWDEGREYHTWLFDAVMGAGKTTLVHAICRFLQVKDRIASPTFALINEYRSPVAGTIYHMDWYRLKNEEEAVNAGIEDTLLSHHYCFVEWPDNAKGILPEKVFRISIEVLDHSVRRLITSTEA